MYINIFKFWVIRSRNFQVKGGKTNMKYKNQVLNLGERVQSGSCVG